MSENNQSEFSSRWKLISAGVLLVVLFFSALVLSLRLFDKLSGVVTNLISVGGTLLTITAYVLLQSYLKPVNTKAQESSNVETTDDSVFDNLDMDLKFAAIESELLSIKLDAKFATLEKEELILQAASIIKEDLKKDFEKAAVIERNEKNATLRRNTILGRYKAAVERLTGEIKEVRKAGTINLLMGSFIAASGVTALTIVVANSPPAKLPALEYAIYFIPRVTLTFVIQLFAYFFLSLYRKAHAEIKFLQNEITNLDMKYIALRTVIDSPEKPVFDVVVKGFISAERNLILKKGETTLELEIARIEKNQTAGLMKELSSLLKSSKEKSNEDDKS